MSRGKEHYKEKIIERSPVEVFTATNTAMFEYPYILGHPDEKSPTLSEQAEVYIMDSGVGDKEKDNDEVFEKAVDIDADCVVPKDIVGDPAATTDAVIDMEKRIMSTDMSMIVPLQADDNCSRCEHYDVLSERLHEPIESYRVAVGGVANEDTQTQITEALWLRDHVGGGQEIHMFGCGITHDWTVTIRRFPWLIDSLDTSRVQREVGNGKTIDGMLDVRPHPMPRGTNSTCVSAMHRERILYMFNHAIGPDARESDVPTEYNDEELKLAVLDFL